MQPLAYLAVRGLIGWLQFVERSDRAFASSSQLIVATGAAHCWAVVYSLFIAIHTRAMRFDGYHEGYTEHLPFWVTWTESLSVYSMGVWWVAGFSTAAIRIMDDDAEGLPSEERDVKPGFFIKLVRNPLLHKALDVAHTLSCVGLFISIVLLCFAMLIMSGGITACELCLVFVSVGFALPHAVVATRRMQDSKGASDSIANASAGAAASEAAALGPQLSVILALADSPGHAYLWQNLVYLVAAISFVAAVAACGRSPPKIGDAALPPETGEFATCLALDIAASVSLVICFPHLNTWHLWALGALVVCLFIAFVFEDWRELCIELLDPLFVTRSDTDKRLPGAQRQRLRRLAWTTALICGTTALWDIGLHPVEEGLWEPEGAGAESYPDLWSADAMLLLRWRSGAGQPTEKELLTTAAEAIGADKEAPHREQMLEAHRLLLFRVPGSPEDRNPAHLRWKAAAAAPAGRLAELLDTAFPTSLNVTLCLHAHAEEELQKRTTTVAPGEKAEDQAAEKKPGNILASIGDPEAQAAYRAACDAWTKVLEGYYGSGSDLEAELEHHQKDASETKGEPDDVDEEGHDI